MGHLHGLAVVGLLAALAGAPAGAQTVIDAGVFGADATVARTAGVFAAPGTYRFRLDFSTDPAEVFGSVVGQTVTVDYCDEPDDGEPPFLCGSDSVPTDVPFAPVTPRRYEARIFVDRDMIVTNPDSFVVRTETYNFCCDVAFEFRSLAAGSFQLSFAAVPEPASWALMIAGFAGAGAMLRRRRVRFAPG